MRVYMNKYATCCIYTYYVCVYTLVHTCILIHMYRYMCVWIDTQRIYVCVRVCRVLVTVPGTQDTLYHFLITPSTPSAWTTLSTGFRRAPWPLCSSPLLWLLSQPRGAAYPASIWLRPSAFRTRLRLPPLGDLGPPSLHLVVLGVPSMHAPPQCITTPCNCFFSLPSTRPWPWG